jgi:hypothetical protein
MEWNYEDIKNGPLPSTTSIASLGAGGKTKTRKELHGFWFLRFYFYWFIDV